jgi:aspartate kinase
MTIIVAKFGGTSVAGPRRIQAVAECIAARHRAGERLVIVVSAMGATTDHLLAQGQALNPLADPRERDLLLSTGELVSCALLAMALQALGVPGRAFTGAQAGITTDWRYGDASITGLAPERLHASLAAGEVPVVAGFQGRADAAPGLADEVTTLGRGGSDTTAVALAVALGAARCEIRTDVDGIFTADPNVVADARRLERVPSAELLEMARHGARVMHPPAVELGAVHGVPILVASSFHEAPGTWITPDGDERAPHGVTAVAHDDGSVSLIGPGLGDAPRLLLHGAAELHAAGISVACMESAPLRHTFRLSEADGARAARALHVGFGLHREPGSGERGSLAPSTAERCTIAARHETREEAALWG